MFTLVPRRSGDRLEDLGNISRQIKVQKADVGLCFNDICEPSPGWVAVGGTGQGSGAGVGPQAELLWQIKHYL